MQIPSSILHPKQLVSQPFHPIIILLSVWGYGEFSRLIPDLERQGVTVCAGMPSDDLIRSVPKPCVVVLDDLMGEVEPKRLADAFTKKAHHNNFTVIFLSQNLFDKAMRVPRSNAQYIFLMRAPVSFPHSLVLHSLFRMICLA
jgi:hypothetical protein